MSKIKTVGHICVDSGQIILVDPCHTEGENINWASVVNGAQFEGKNCYVIENEYENGIYACCNTGYGDGVYPVEVEICDETERVMNMKITFMEKEGTGNIYEDIKNYLMMVS